MDFKNTNYMCYVMKIDDLTIFIYDLLLFKLSTCSMTIPYDTALIFFGTGYIINEALGRYSISTTYFYKGPLHKLVFIFFFFLVFKSQG